MWGRLLVVGFLGAGIGAVAVWFALDHGDENKPPAPSLGKTHESPVGLSTSAPDVPQSLAEIVVNPTDFQRNTELYALLGDTGPWPGR